MDQDSNLAEMRPVTDNDDAIRHLGLTLCKLINAHTWSDEETELFWQFAKTQEYMFNDFERGNREGFIARLRDLRHLHLDIGGDGYALLVNAWCCDTPEIHFCIWNPRRHFSQTLEAGSEILNFVFHEMKAARISGFIPENNKLALKFATMLGFKFEGCVRQAHLFFGRRWDVHCYGLLRNEWDKRQERLNNVSK